MPHFQHKQGNAGAISLRSHSVGGTVRDQADTSPPDLLEEASRLIVFVHGFNVTEVDANDAYDLFERHLSPGNRARVVRLYWAGDTSTRADSLRGQRGWISKMISPISYMWKPKPAMRSSQKLARKLKKAFVHRTQNRKNEKLELCFVAHSLGCLLTLETLYQAHDSASELPLVVLMAAAVPQYLVTGDGQFTEMIAELPKLWVLHSQRDTVLSRFFRPGQFFERAPFPDFRFSVRGALGRKGMPGNDRISVLKGTWDHSDYWPDRDVAEAVDSELSNRWPERQAFAMLTRKVWERPVQPRLASRRTITEIYVASGGQWPQG